MSHAQHGPKRVLLDVSSAFMGDTGVARYSRSLLDALQPTTEFDVEAVAITRRADGALRGVRTLRLPRRLMDPLWVRGMGRMDRWLGDADMLHATGHVPVASRLTTVLTVHDVLGVTLPHLHPRASVRLHRRLIELLRAGMHAVVPSQATRDDMVQLGVSADRITVTPLAPTLVAPPGQGLPSSVPYVLSVGSLVPRKDPVTAVRSLAGLHDQLHLVLAGPFGPALDDVRRASRQLGLDGRVHVLGHVSDGDLVALYERALAFITTSLGEGFGIPVLEAMTRGVPVVASDLPVHREVAGDAALFASCSDPGSFAAAVSALIEDEEVRQRHVDRGIARAGGYSWKMVAERTTHAWSAAVAARH